MKFCFALDSDVEKKVGQREVGKIRKLGESVHTPLAVAKPEPAITAVSLGRTG